MINIFKKHLLDLLDQSYKIKQSEVDYICLDKNNWCSLEEFINLEILPSSWDYLYCEKRIWENLPNDFKIVLFNKNWITYYYNWDDPYYSTFMNHKLPEKPDIHFTQ